MWRIQGSLSPMWLEGLRGKDPLSTSDWLVQIGDEVIGELNNTA